MRKFDEETISAEDLESLLGGVSEALSLTSDSVDYYTRTIMIDDTIDYTTIRKYVLPIIEFNKTDDLNGLEPEERLPITIYSACGGGDVHAGFALIDVIKASKTPIIGVNLSVAFSMGALIFLACHKRYCYEHASFLIHDGMFNISTSGEKAKDQFKFYMGVQDKYIKDFILENTNISPKTLDKNMQHEWYLTSNEALECGVVDEIIDRIM